MSRGTKLDANVQEKIVALIAEGDRPEVAAGVNGIGRATYFEWMQRGSRDEEPYASFRTAVARAIDKFESGARRTILAGDEKGSSFGPAKAALELLSRRMPRQWAQQVKLHVESVEDEFLDALSRVCADRELHARVCQAEDCSELFAAFCQALVSQAGGDSATEDS